MLKLTYRSLSASWRLFRLLLFFDCFFLFDVVFMFLGYNCFVVTESLYNQSGAPTSMEEKGERNNIHIQHIICKGFLNLHFCACRHHASPSSPLFPLSSIQFSLHPLCTLPPAAPRAWILTETSPQHPPPNHRHLTNELPMNDKPPPSKQTN